MLRQQIRHSRNSRNLLLSSVTQLPQGEEQCRCFCHERSFNRISGTNIHRAHLPSNPTCSQPAKEHVVLGRRHTSSPRRLEPWVDPRSLSKSLEAHRQANREGYARDGVPVQNPKVHHHRPTKRPRASGPWVGMKVLRLDMPQQVQQPDSNEDGTSPPLLSEWRVRRALPINLKYPWLAMLRTQNNDAIVHTALQQLNLEIRAWDAYFSPSETERHAAMTAFSDITRVLGQTSVPLVNTDLIGSRASGTDCPISDLDINISLQPEADTSVSSSSQRTKLRRLYLDMFQRRFKKTILPHAYLAHARVPLITGTHVPTGLEFQIQSTISSFETLEVARAFIAEHPSAQIVFKLIKQMLSMRGLTSGQSGGLTSYPLLNMVVTSLKLAGPRLAADDIAGQLLFFLEFWSKFNFKDQKVVITPTDREDMAGTSVDTSIDPISTVPRIVSKDVREVEDTYKMSMEDPADPSNNLGRNTSGIKNIQACFIMARYSLSRSLSEWETVTNHGDRRGTPLLAWMVGGDYTFFEEARWQLRRYNGEKEL